MNYYVLLLPLILFSCSFPNDSNKSWDKAVSREFKVGLILSHNTGDINDNEEVILIQKFAHLHNLKLKIYTADETSLFHDLEKYNNCVVIGKITEKSIWKEKVAFTKPYDEVHVFAVTKGENKLLYKLEAFLNNQH